MEKQSHEMCDPELLNSRRFRANPPADPNREILLPRRELLIQLNREIEVAKSKISARHVHYHIFGEPNAGSGEQFSLSFGLNQLTDRQRWLQFFDLLNDQR